MREWTAVFDLYVELRRIAEALDAAGVAYALAGGLAVSIYTTPRATEDIDLLIRRELLEMRVRLPSDVIDSSSELPLLAQAARLRRWLELQEQIERCNVCIRLHPSEVSTPLRPAEIPLPPIAIKVLFVGVAPTRPAGRSQGTHFYSNRSDGLRTSLFHALDTSSFRTRLAEANGRSKDQGDSAFHEAGFFFVHAGKVRPARRDAPPTAVLEACAREHLRAEIQVLQPDAVCLLGVKRGHLPSVAGVLFERELHDVPEGASVDWPR